MKLRSNIFRYVLLIAASLSTLSSTAFAQSAENKIALEVLPGWRSNDGTHVAALKLTMAPGWVTYWRVPGEAGIPPQFDFKGSKNVLAVSFVWPKPTVEVKNGFRSFVYYDQVVIPLKIGLNSSDQTARIRGRLKLGVCADICIPVSLNFDAILPDQGNEPTDEIQHALKSRARISSTQVTCAFLPNPTGMGVRIVAKNAKLRGKEHVVVEHRDQTLRVSPVRFSRHKETLTIETIIADGIGLPSGLQRKDLRITLIGDQDMVEFVGCKSPS